MKSDVAHRQIRSALRAELKRRHGQIGQIEADLSRSEGYLSRFCRGDLEITLKGCLETLEALEVEPGSFFSTALGTVTRSEDILLGLEGNGPFDRSLSAFVEAASDIRSSPEVSSATRRQHAACVAGFKDLAIESQLRRLRSGRKYRTECFVKEYLDSLERLRYDDPKAATRLVVGLAAYVVPHLPSSHVVRIEWLCRCIEVYASCLRSTDASRSAARALRIGLRLSRAHGLEAGVAALLRRAAFVASDFADYERGLFLLREAQDIALEIDDQRNLGFIAVTKAMLHSYSGDYAKSRRCYERGLRLLQIYSDAEVRRWLLGAYSGLVNIFTNLGDTEAALGWLGKATDTFQDEGGLILGKLLWHQGSIEHSVGRLQPAAENLRAARKLLEAGSGMEFALVSIELASVLLELKNHMAALEVAKSLVVLTDSLENNPLAQGALLEFMRVVLSGGLDLFILAQLKESIEKGRSLRSAPSRGTRQ